MITEDYVDFNLAELLKDKGYPQQLEEGCSLYNSNKKRFIYTIHDPFKHSYVLVCPSIYEVQMWFNKNHNLYLIVDCPFKKSHWYYTIDTVDLDSNNIITIQESFRIGKHYKNYQEALVEGIKMALKLI